MAVMVILLQMCAIKIPSFLYWREILCEIFQRFYKIVMNQDADSAFKMEIHLFFSLLL